MDSLVIHSVIIHELIKQPEMAECNLVLSEDRLPVTENVINMISELDGKFERRSDVLQGYLPTISGGVSMLDTYMILGYHPADIVGTTRRMSKDLQSSLNGVIGARGGYLVFADYTIEEQRVFACFMLRDATGLVIDHNEDAGLNLQEVKFTDLGSMPMAVRILRGDGRVVQVLQPNRKSQDIGPYFLDWVSMGSSETSSELTRTFMEMVEELPIPKDRDTGFAMDESDFEASLLKYAAKQPQQTIRVKDFDDYYYGGQGELQKILDETDDGGVLDDGFRVDQKLLRTGFYMKAKDNGISVQCTRRHVRSNVIEIDEEAGVVKIYSPELAAQLLDQQE